MSLTHNVVSVTRQYTLSQKYAAQPTRNRLLPTMQPSPHSHSTNSVNCYCAGLWILEKTKAIHKLFIKKTCKDCSCYEPMRSSIFDLLLCLHLSVTDHISIVCGCTVVFQDLQVSCKSSSSLVLYFSTIPCSNITQVSLNTCRAEVGGNVLQVVVVRTQVLIIFT